LSFLMVSVLEVRSVSAAELSSHSVLDLDFFHRNIGHRTTFKYGVYMYDSALSLSSLAAVSLAIPPAIAGCNPLSIISSRCHDGTGLSWHYPLPFKESCRVMSSLRSTSPLPNQIQREQHKLCTAAGIERATTITVNPSFERGTARSLYMSSLPENITRPPFEDSDFAHTSRPYFQGRNHARPQ
jgi:hypothetical protein